MFKFLPQRRTVNYCATVDNLTPELRKSYCLTGLEGIIVTEIIANSSAQAFGLKRGDVLLQLNVTPLTSPGQFIDLL